MDNEELARAVERRKSVEEKLRHDAKEMTEVLRSDIPTFFVREAKRRFVGWAEGEKWSDDQLKRFKTEMKAAGDKAANDLAQALASWDAWAWDTRNAFPENPTGLEANTRVWGRVRKVGEELANLLERHGLPDPGAAKDAYKLPAYFVAGRFMKSLVESYWRGLAEHAELGRFIEESSSKDRREKLSERWDRA
jgi:hypothetical protein